jgi:hypothetical protein
MNRLRLTTAAALASLGLLCGCANTTNTCGEREGLFSRWFGTHRQGQCECIETGRVTVGDGPVVPDPGFGEQGYPVTTPTFPTTPPPTILPMPNAGSLAQPLPANPSSLTKDARK